ncbi:hypothetical protein M0R45_011911 [Rubus argutus]|uniref:Uncharacterized protein n=1 Tax=Rubus argutus TaxID=59490 RepID=A0AAW1YCK1_RUBAR
MKKMSSAWFVLVMTILVLSTEFVQVDCRAFDPIRRLAMDAKSRLMELRRWPEWEALRFLLVTTHHRAIIILLIGLREELDV